MAVVNTITSSGQQKVEEKTNWKACGNVVGLLVTVKEVYCVSDLNELRGYAINLFDGTMAPACQLLT
jgi:hypothetical protein